jgi:hypothetical protein
MKKMNNELTQLLMCPKDNYIILHDTGEEYITCPHCYYKGLREEFVKIYD